MYRLLARQDQRVLVHATLRMRLLLDLQHQHQCPLRDALIVLVQVGAAVADLRVSQFLDRPRILAVAGAKACPCLEAHRVVPLPGMGIV